MDSTILEQTIDFKLLGEIAVAPGTLTRIQRGLENLELRTNQELKELFLKRGGDLGWYKYFGDLTNRHLETYMLEKELIDLRRPYLFMPNLSNEEIKEGTPITLFTGEVATAQIEFTQGEIVRQRIIYPVGVSRLKRKPRLVYGDELFLDERRVARALETEIDKIISYKDVQVIKNSERIK